MSSLKKKFVLTMALILSILIGSFAGILLLNQKNKIYAANDPEPTVAKVNLYYDDGSAEGEYYIMYDYFKKETGAPEAGKKYFIYNDKKNELSSYTPTDMNEELPSNAYKLMGVVKKSVDLNRLQEVLYNPFLKDNLIDDSILKSGESGEILLKPHNTFKQYAKNDDNIFMIKNSNIERETFADIFVAGSENNFATSGEYNKSYNIREFVLVQFKADVNKSATLLSLTVNIQLTNSNGAQLNIDPGDYTTTSQTSSYSQLFDLTNIYELGFNSSTNNIDSTKISEHLAQGKYDFTFTYNLSSNGTVTTDNIKSASCYMLSESYYINSSYHGDIAENVMPRDNIKNSADIVFVKNAENVDTEYYYNGIYNNNLELNNAQTEPRMYNTERIDKMFYEGELRSEKDNFYFNNSTTEDYNGQASMLESSQNLQYPTITYDASRYNVSYSKTMYGITTDVTTLLDISNEAEPKLVLNYENPSKSWTDYLPVVAYQKSNDTHKQYIASIQFSDIGKYIFSVNFVLGDIVFAKENDKFAFEKENWNLIHSYELTIFGYQLMHSEYKNESGATEKEMKYVDNDSSKSIFADVTNSNMDWEETNIVTIDLTESPINYPVNLLNGNLAKTNQAPLFFRYYAKLNGNVSDSYYLYYRKNGNVFVSNTNASDSLPQKNALTSNTRFTDNGLYVICLSYIYQGYEYLSNSSTITVETQEKLLKQIFIFEIENIEPQVDFYQYDTGNYENKDPLLTGGYTNKTVEINWEKTLNNPFDVTPNVIVYRNDFDEDKNDIKKGEIVTKNMSAAELAKLQHGIIQVNKNGFYTIIIEYGPCTYAGISDGAYKYIYSASVVTNFTIDKEEIGSGENIVEFYEDNTSNKPLIERLVATTKLFTNRRFAVIYGTISDSSEIEIKTTQRKKSGARISVSYTFMPININSDFDDGPLNSNKIIPNGAIISTKNEGIAYDSYLVQDNFGDKTSALISDGIYIFTFVDEAGNSYSRWITKDTSAPALFQKIDGNITKIPASTANYDNLVNLDTEIIWGENKAIKLTDEILETLSPYIADTSILYNNDTNNYLLIKIQDNNTINRSVPEDDESAIWKESNKKGITIYYRDKEGHYKTANDSHNTSTSISYTIKAHYMDGDDEVIIENNEHLFKIAVFDQMGNGFLGKVEMSFDKSALRAYVSGQPQKNVQIINANSRFDSSGDSVENKLDLYSVSNKKNLYFSWVKGSGEFTVESVKCEFYPLTFELRDNVGGINPNYPYSYNYTRTFELTTEETTQQYSSESNNGIVQTTERVRLKFPVNALHDARFDGDTATVVGMYVIKRTYVGPENPEETMKDKERTYVFYIDRNNLISTENKTISNDHFIGETLAVQFGDYDNESNTYIFSGRDFLQDFVVDEIFTTNRQPGKMILSPYSPNGYELKYKYLFAYNEELDGELLSEYEFYEDLLEHTLIGVNRINFKIYDIEDENKERAFDISDNLNHFKGNLIGDYTGYNIVVSDQANGSQTSLEFSLGVKLTPPQANFVENENLSVLTGSQNNYISRNNTDVSLTWTIDEKGINSKINENDITITQIFENGRKIVIYSDKDGINLSNNSKIVHTDEEDENNRYINFADFSSVINKEVGNCRIEVVLKYLTNNPSYYGQHLSVTKIIYFDYEKPQYNFNNLLEKDAYLENIGVSKEEFEDYTSDVNFENYAFIVDSDFNFKIPPASSFWQQDLVEVTRNSNDLESVWYRKYNKYQDDTGINQQSLVPGDPRYNVAQDAPTRLNFDPNLYITVKDSLGNDQYVQAYKEIYGSIERFNFPEKGCYYEIIEKDCADNYRVYTIYVLNDAIDEEIIYNESSTIEDLPITTEMHLNMNDGTYFEINNLGANFFVENEETHSKGFNNLGEWFIIKVTDVDIPNETNIYYVSPLNIEDFVSLEYAVSQVNSLIVDPEKVGKYFKIEITTPKYQLIDINYRTPGQKYELDAVITSTSLVVTVDPARYSGTYLKTLKVFEADDNGILSEEPLQFDSNEQTIKTGPYSPQDNVVRYVFTYSASKVRNLWFKYTDNFGMEYRENFILGIRQTPFENMLVFDGNYIQNENYAAISTSEISKENFDKFAEYYSPAKVTLEYQQKIYGKPTIYKFDKVNGWNVITLTEQTSYGNIESIVLFGDEDSQSGDDIYLIVFTDTAGKNYQLCVHYYTKIADLHFIDSSAREHCFDIYDDSYEFSISKVVYLSYEQFDTNASYPIKTTITAKRTYKNNENITMTKDYGVIDDKFLFNEFGTYTLTATNELGLSKIYKFEYVKSEAIYYSVKANVNGSTVFLSPSPVKHPTYDIDTYVSIYEMTIDINQERNLKMEQDLSKSNLDTRVYRIYSEDEHFNYEKYIALTQIEKTSDLLRNVASITEYKTVDGEQESYTTSISSKYVKSNAEKMILTLPSYNEFGIIDNSVNLIRVRIVYENKDLGIVNEYNKNEFNAERPCIVELKTAGQYKIYIYDLAGNQHLFNGSEYLEISLINNFSYKLNGKRGLYNSIYNEKVSLFVEQRSNFVSDSNGRSYTITSTLNGEPYSPKIENDSYVFTSYGTYVVTLKGYLNRDSNGSLINEVITTAKFTILNPNEARLMHEYIGLNGYEVTKIVKNNNDVTEDIKSRLNVSSINKFAISGLTDGIGGSGVYQITVKATLDKIVGDAEFTYSVWINNDSDVLIVPSIAEGGKTTRKISLQLNYYQIYSKIGECQLKVNGVVYADINEASANTTTTITLSSNSRFNVTLETLSGNTISSLVVTKIEPLNSVAIIVIVITSTVVAGLTFTFILFRKRMRVR